jgi:hypothetical protein
MSMNKCHHCGNVYEGQNTICGCPESVAIATDKTPIEVDSDALEYAFQTGNAERNNAGLRILDLCFTAFMKARDTNDEDGGPTDWMTDTKPLIDHGIEKILKQITL